MAKPIDAVTSFTHLTDNLPDWISQIEKLSTHAAEKNADFTAEYTRLLRSARPKRVKSPSVTSIHTNNDRPAEASKVDSPQADVLSTQTPNLPEISPFEAGNRYLYAQARRVRKTGSSVRTGASGPQKFRTKQSVVIYYDAFLQEQLDGMVKSIATARNNLRKGKMSRSLQKGLQLPSFGRKFSDTYSSSNEDLYRAFSPMKSTKSLPIDTKGSPAMTKPDEDADFSKADTDLQTAQSLCEIAAHQFLRDGDCKVELKGIKAKFDVLLTLATAAVSKLEAEQAMQDAEARTEKSHTDSEDTLVEPASRELLTTADLVPSLSVIPTAALPNLAVISASEIEVDDSDAESLDPVDISKFRSARANRGIRAMA